MAIEIAVALLLLLLIAMAVFQLVRTLRNPTRENIDKLDRYFFRRSNPWQKERHPSMEGALLCSIIYIVVMTGFLIFFLTKRIGS